MGPLRSVRPEKTRLINSKSRNAEERALRYKAFFHFTRSRPIWVGAGLVWRPEMIWDAGGGCIDGTKFRFILSVHGLAQSGGNGWSDQIAGAATYEASEWAIISSGTRRKRIETPGNMA